MTLSPREIFIYLIVALTKDETIAVLDKDRKTAILEIMRSEFCPQVTDEDWAVISQDIDHQLQPELTKKLFSCIQRGDLLKINDLVLQRWQKQGRKQRFS